MPRLTLLPALLVLGGLVVVGPAALADVTPESATTVRAPAASTNAGSSRAPAAGRRVSTSAGLAKALASARPGTVVNLARGVYSTRHGFTIPTRCTAAAPCVLRGRPGAIIDGHGVTGVYGLHLDRASYWTVTGLTVRNASKGVVLDRSSHTTLSHLAVHHIGDEGIHLRSNSTYDLVTDSTVHHTGLRKPTFGEGVYVGSAKSNWKRYTGGRPDRSDHNVVTRNHIRATGAESVDIKEGTRGGTLSDNTFDGARMRSKNADSWVDVKGNGWQVVGNHGVHSPADGFQTHVLLDGWGRDNVFRGNVADTRSSGYGFYISDADSTGNRVSCGNTARTARSGLSNQPCR